MAQQIDMFASEPKIEGHATFSGAGEYRDSLVRRWNADRGRVLFIMLNPSTADARADDPTLRRCIDLATHWGFGELEVVNLFGLRSTDPDALRTHADPVGSMNDLAITAAARRAETIVVAWGDGGELLDRDRAVLALLDALARTPPHRPAGPPRPSRQAGRLKCIGLTQRGNPRHPLQRGLVDGASPKRAALVDFCPPDDAP